MTKRERLVLGGILVVALTLRVAWCVWAARVPAGGLHDPSFYYLYGQQLADGNGYRLPDGSPTAYYPPGYSFSLTPFMWLVDRWPLDSLRNVEVGIVSALNVVWQLVTMVLAFLIARRLSGGRVIAGYVAAGVLAAWPNLVFHTAAALTESLFNLLLLATVLLVVSAPRGAVGWERRRWVTVGIVLGVATLVRPVTIPLFPALLVVFLVGGAGWRRSFLQTAAVTGVAVLVLAPWMLRNAVVMEQVTLSTNTGDNLCMSRHVGATGGFELPNDECFMGTFDSLERPEFELARDRHGRQVAIDFIREHPGEELRLVLRRIGALFTDDADGLEAVESYGDDPWMSSTARRALRGIANGYGLMAGLVGVAGAVVLVRRWAPDAIFVVLAGIGMLLPPLVFFGDPRFHVPAVPVAAIAIGALAASLRSGELSSST